MCSVSQSESYIVTVSCSHETCLAFMHDHVHYIAAVKENLVNMLYCCSEKKSSKYAILLSL